MKSIEELQRYTVHSSCDWCEIPCSDGSYVKYDDVKKLLDNFV